MEQAAFVVMVSMLVLGVIIGYYFRFLRSMQKKESIEFDVKKRILAAKEKASEITKEAEERIAKKEQLALEQLEKQTEISQEKEGRLLQKESVLDKRQLNIDEIEKDVRTRLLSVDRREKENEKQYQYGQGELERIAGLSTREARKELFDDLEKQYEQDVLARIQKLETAGHERLRSKARDILTTAIHRYGNATTPDVTTTNVTIESEDVKGKIIGKEGRNIRAFERAAGVELIIDETPGLVIISAFDPLRRHIAKDALENLIEDGRIQPSKIEKYVEDAEEGMAKAVEKKGKEAASECGINNLDPRITSILGRLAFRTSYGQNVLRHSIETAHIAGMLAGELEADVGIAKSGALLHDIGKAVDHHVSGTHVEIGRRILQKYGVDPRIIQAMQAHHEEYPYETPESVIVQVADSISASRPGARRGSVDNYLKRLSELEALANSFEGIVRSYALQAGREIRIFVEPENTSDLEAQKMAREIALRVEDELRYPGEIKISVIRESRYIEYAR